MPELPRKPGLPLEEKAQIDPAAEAPSPRAPHPSSGKTDPQGEAAPSALPAPAALLPPAADESLPMPPASDDATPMAEVEEPAPAPLPDAGEAAAIGAMSAAEEAVRRRAEADYQRAIDDAIRAVQWRTDDAVYVGLVDELVRLRGPGGVESGSLSSAVRSADGYDAPWGAPARAPGAGAWGADGSAAYGMSGEADAASESEAQAYLTNAAQTGDPDFDDGQGTLLAQALPPRGGGGNRRGPGGPFGPSRTPDLEKILRRHEDIIRQLEPNNPKLSYIRDRNIPPSSEFIRSMKLESEAAAFRFANKLSFGHGFRDHGREFERFGRIITPGDYAAIAQRILTDPRTRIRDLGGGTFAYYSRSENAVVIVDPVTFDRGTMYRVPKGHRGERYFNELEKR